MPPDRARDARRWFLKPCEDLRASRHDLTATPPLVEDALFHAQQTVEKAAKGFLVWHARNFRKVHDLREIGGAAAAIDESLKPILQRAVRLGPFAGIFRYPTDMGVPTIEEVREALALAEEVYESVLARLSPEARP